MRDKYIIYSNAIKILEEYGIKERIEDLKKENDGDLYIHENDFIMNITNSINDLKKKAIIKIYQKNF